MDDEAILEHGNDCKALLDNEVFIRLIEGMTTTNTNSIFSTKPSQSKERSIIYYQQLALQQIVALLQHGISQAEQLASELEYEQENPE